MEKALKPAVLLFIEGPGSFYDMRIVAAGLNKNLGSSVHIHYLCTRLTCIFLEKQEYYDRTLD